MGTRRPPHLTRRERLALTLMMQKCTAAEIGDALNISERTARALIARVAHRLAEASQDTDPGVARAGGGQAASATATPRRLH